MPLVIMEPVKGGNLAGFSDDINDRFHQMDPEASVASFALRWVGSHPNVKVIFKRNVHHAAGGGQPEDLRFL